MRLGLIIQNYRNKTDISMEEFAHKSGISKSYIGFLEKGVHPKTKKVICPSVDIINKAAIAMGMEFDTLFNMIDEKITIKNGESHVFVSESIKSIKIPVLGKVAAGNPIDAIEDIIDYVEIPETLASHGEFFGLVIKGDSMYPRIYDGDTIIIKKCDYAEPGDIVIATVNYSEVVCKKFINNNGTTVLRSINPDFEDIDVTNNPDFKIIGVAIELRSQFKAI